MLDGLLAVRDFDGAFVLACHELTLYENMAAFLESRGELLEALAECDHVMPLSSVLPFAGVVFPRFLGGDPKLHDGRAVRQKLDFGVSAEESDDSVLIEVHKFFFFLPCLLGHLEASGGCSQTKEVLSMGDQNNFSIALSELCEH